MKKTNAKLTRNAYNWIFSLSRKQTAMLKDKDVALAELYDLCDNDIQRNLIKDLIIRFHCFDEEIYNLALMQIVEHISELGYNISGFITSLGIGGVVITLAAQDTAKSLIGGALIIIDKPFSRLFH